MISIEQKGIVESNPFEISLTYESHIVQMRNVIRDMGEFANSLIVQDEGSYKAITAIYADARKWKKAIEMKRKETIDPLRKKTAEVNDRAKEFTDPLDHVIEIANTKTANYLNMVREKAQQDEEAIRAAAAIFDVAEEIYIPPVEVGRGDGAVAVTKIEKAFRVIDIAKVPAKYLMVDESAIKKDLKLGIAEIPGLEIYEETKTQLRIR